VCCWLRLHRGRHSAQAVAHRDRHRGPDCARYRRDGTNEIDGIHPDIALDWTLSDRTGRWVSYAEKALSEADRLFRAAR
jgi:hypothetical protein